MAELKINNFGAIKSADLQLRKYNIYIGDTSCGKSTAAKLAAIFNTSELKTLKNGDTTSFKKLLDKYNIDYQVSPDTSIEYTSDEYFCKYTADGFESNSNGYIINHLDKEQLVKELLNDPSLVNNKQIQSLKFLSKYVEEKDKKLSEILDDELLYSLAVRILIGKYTPIYIPAERLMISILNRNIFGLINAGVQIPECVSSFGKLYETARNKKNSMRVDFLNMTYNYDNNEDRISIADSNDNIPLTQASSGVQSVVPMLLVLDYYLSSNEDNIIVIEEPQLNLFPTSQLGLMNWIVGKTRKDKDNEMIITTHSPYILSTFDNYVHEGEILKRLVMGKKGSDVTTFIRKMITSVDGLFPVLFEQISSYYFGKDGVVKDIKDYELKTIGAEHIDEASFITNSVFNKLCDLEDEL